MRIILVLILLLSSCSNVLYAQVSDAWVLEQLETKIDAALDLIEQKADSEVKAQINKKQDEIGVFLDAQQEKLAKASSKQEQETIVQESK